MTIAAGVALLGGTAIAAAGPAGAVDPTKGYAGICTGSDALTGVTIVVDFQELDGNGGVAAPTITRCSPNASPGTARTGIKALQDAGISIVGTIRWGFQAVCRIEGRPTATEDIPRNSNPTYHEACVNTPPGEAYWGYWYADGSGTTWTYSNSGATARNVIPGGFEGWSFSLNHTPTTNPPPEVTPRNPAIG
ncbi:flagellar hook-length control protein FliK [Amycolatopsis sp. MtRt-6]|uniref:flagellar hook-length control protein FliK n=1 Tax=Amycolatopsis sp. MtRt-6 TaxID=2792782 RepID=UPI001F5DE320|nr:flagellar hook-length control protein FliK [Amycolatopsis sp. MtRt-6]